MSQLIQHPVLRRRMGTRVRTRLLVISVMRRESASVHTDIKMTEEEKIQDVNANRAEKYARYSLKKAGFAKEKGLDIEVTTVKDALAASHVEVKVTAQYEIPFGFAMKYFGQSPYREFTATGRAVCLDIQHYIYTNKSLDAMEDAIGAGVSSSVIKTAEKVISIIRSGFKALKK